MGIEQIRADHRTHIGQVQIELITLVQFDSRSGPFRIQNTVSDQIGGRIGLLYSVNTAGAVAGTVGTAFLLLPSMGLRATIWVAAGINGLVFLVAWALARRSSTPAAPSDDASEAAAFSRARWVVPAILVSGAVSFSYEVLWFRLFAHVLGGSVRAFAKSFASMAMRASPSGPPVRSATNTIHTIAIRF